LGYGLYISKPDKHVFSGLKKPPKIILSKGRISGAQPCFYGPMAPAARACWGEGVLFALERFLRQKRLKKQDARQR